MTTCRTCGEDHHEVQGAAGSPFCPHSLQAGLARGLSDGLWYMPGPRGAMVYAGKTQAEALATYRRAIATHGDPP